MWSATININRNGNMEQVANLHPMGTWQGAMSYIPSDMGECTGAMEVETRISGDHFITTTRILYTNGHIEITQGEYRDSRPRSMWVVSYRGTTVTVSAADEKMAKSQALRHFRTIVVFNLIKVHAA